MKISSLLTRSSLLILYILSISHLVISQDSKQENNEKEKFFEELLIKPLEDNKVMAHFQFTNQWKTNQDLDDASTYENFYLFPKSIGQTIHQYKVRELHMAFTQGRWWNQWGYPISPAPVGVELWSWFNEEKDQSSIDSLWKGLTSSLSGLFCATLQQMSTVYTSQPKYSFFPQGNSNYYRNETVSTDNLRYSVLAREAVCTENLTPWLKLLPCRGKAGIASLLNSLELYNVDYHSMGLHIRRICDEPNCKKPTLELVQTLTIVFDPVIKSGSQDWSLQKIFGREIVQACPLASISKVHIESPSKKNSQNYKYDIEYTTSETTKSIPSPSSSISKSFDLTQSKSFSLSAKYNLNKNYKEINKVSENVVVNRYFTGYGQEFGGIAVNIINNNEYSTKISFFEVLPWYLRLFLHTLRVTVNGEELKEPLKVFEKYSLIPAEDHSTPACLELETTLDPHTTLFFTVQFEKAFLHYTEHPPDAHRGFDIGSASVTFQVRREGDEFLPSEFFGLEWSSDIYQQFHQQNGSKQISYQRIYTEPLLVSLPTPDFSMPYNVITLTGTMFTLLFGSMYTTLVRRMRHLSSQENFVSNRPIVKLIRKVFQMFSS